MAFLRSLQSASRLGALVSVRPVPKFVSPMYQARCSVTMKISEAKADTEKAYDEKNMKLNRPLSPHLLIYKPQLTSMMSISHRITGLMIVGYGVCLAASSFSSYDVPRIVAAVEAMHIPGALMFLVKYILAFPVAYHMVNGVRHLSWDLAIGITKKKVYTSGYVALGLSVALALYFASI